MFTNRKIPGFVSCILLALVLGACTLSPQTLSLKPVLDSSALAKEKAAQLRLQVVDKRQSNVIGFRGGVYATAAISSDEKSMAAIQEALAAELKQLGFVIVGNEAASANKLLIEITGLNYKVTSEKIPWAIAVSASIKATADTAARKSTLDLQDRRTKEYAKFPSMEQNEAIINDLISSLLQRVLEDREFLRLLSN